MKTLQALIFIVLLAAIGLTAHAQQTDNHGIHAAPAPGAMVIDGKLNDWDLSGKVFMCYDMDALRDTFSAEVAMMHDAANLYVAVHWKDATPMGNSHDPRYMASRGWAGDCLQLRVRTDKITHVTAWYHAETKAPAIHLDFGVGLNKAFGGGSKVLARTEGWKLDEGAEMAFVADADGKGYVQELKLPWKLITNEKTFKAGDTIACGYELLWGEGDWPVHRYADNLAEGASSREFFFTAVQSWGTIYLESAGNLKLPEPAYLKAARELDGVGPVEISYELPKDARVTLAIDDASGKRVRSLIAARPRKTGKNVELWDGVNDQGKIVDPGNYRYKVLYHDGLHVNYVMSFASPGNPSWDTPDGTGAWYGDHSPAIAAAAGGDYAALLCPIGEAGKHLIGVDLNGQRKWGLHNRLYADGIAVATDGKTLYIASYLPTSNKERSFGRTFVWRCELATGKFSPWLRKDSAGAAVLDLDVVPDGTPDACRGIAYREGQLAVLLATQNRVQIVDGKNGDTVKDIKDLPESLNAIAWAPDGRIIVAGGDALLAIDVASGKSSKLAAGLVSPFGLACDAQNNIYVSQRGAKQNVAVFDAQGKKLRDIGKDGGRPAHGAFIDEVMRNPGRIAIDSKGRLWVPESTLNPKRTSVWSADGKLITDYIGSTHYASSGAINPHDATMAFADDTVFKIDLAKGTSRPVYSIGPRGLADEVFRPSFDSHVRVVKHGDDTLLYSSDRTGTVYCILQSKGEWRIASAVGYVQKANHNEVNANWLHPLMKDHVGEPFSWADKNGDALVQADELQFGKPTLDGKPVESRGCYWGVLPETDGTINFISVDSNALVKLPILEYTACGAPRYETTIAKVVVLDSKWPKFGFANLQHILGGSDGKVFLNQSPLTIVGKDGQIVGVYPSTVAGVHGSHNALSAKPGYLIGPNTVLGSADFGGEIGEVFDLNGNLGENYLFTADGMWIQALFKDTRGVFEQPAKAVRGMPMDAITAGGESFGGQFVRTPDGKAYLLIGGTDARVLEIIGLDSIKRLAGSVAYTPEQYAKARALSQERAAKALEAKRIKIVKASDAPVIDGKATDWPELTSDGAVLAEIRETPQKKYGRVSLRYDNQNLYVAWRVIGPGAIRNGGQDERQLFKTGDCVDLMLGPAKSEKGQGNLRVLVSKVGKEMVAVIYQKVVPGTAEKDRVGFSSPWRTIYFDKVSRVQEVKIASGPMPSGCFIEAAIPWKSLGVEPQSGLKLRGDFGVLFGDSGGTTTVSRQYWSNKSTGLVNDVPGEADLTPTLWGDLELE